MANDTIQYNNISDALKKLVVWPTDSKGKKLDTVVYEWGRKTQMHELNPDNERSLVETHPGNYLPSTDTIYDAGQDDYVELAFYESMRPGAPGTNNPATPALLPIEFTSENRGFLYVPNTSRGRKLFQFLELCNMNSNSVNPDAKKPGNGIEFGRVKPEATAEDQLDREEEIMRLKALVMKMEVPQLRDLAPRVGVNSTLDKNQLKMALIRKVEAEPALVNANMNTEIAKIIADVQDAITRKVVMYSDDDNAFVWYNTQEPFATIPTSTVDKAQALADFLGSSEDGLRLRGKIVDALSAARKGGTTATAAPRNEDERPRNPRQQKAIANKGNKPAAKSGGRFVKKEQPAPAPAVPESTEADY